MLRKGMIRMRMHKSKDYRCLTSEQKKQKKQKYERKRKNAENMLYFMPLLVFIFISNIKCLLSSDFELFGLNSQSLCKIEAILLLFLYMCVIRNYLSKDLMKNMSEEISAEKEREEENEKK